MSSPKTVVDGHPTGSGRKLQLGEAATTGSGCFAAATACGAGAGDDGLAGAGVDRGVAGAVSARAEGAPTDTTPVPGVCASAATACVKSIPCRLGGVCGAWMVATATGRTVAVVDWAVAVGLPMVEQAPRSDAIPTINAALPRRIMSRLHCQSGRNQQNTKKNRIQDSKDRVAQSLSKKSDMTRDLPVLRMRRGRLHVASPPADLDTREAYAAIGATGDGESPLRVDAEAALRTLTLRLGPLLVTGPRGGTRMTRLPKPETHHRLLPWTAQVDLGPLRRGLPMARAWDLLTWAPSMPAPSFVALDAVAPSALLRTRHKSLLLRARFAPDDWRYVSYNVAGGEAEGIWRVGSREGWSVRDAAAMRLLSLPAIRATGPAEQWRRPERARPLRDLEKRLTKAFGSALVYDADDTLRPEGMVVGSSAAALRALHRAVGRVDTAEIVVIVRRPRRGLTRAVLDLAGREGMLLAIQHALVDQALTSS